MEEGKSSTDVPEVFFGNNNGSRFQGCDPELWFKIMLILYSLSQTERIFLLHWFSVAVRETVISPQKYTPQSCCCRGFTGVCVWYTYDRLPREGRIYSTSSVYRSLMFVAAQVLEAIRYDRPYLCQMMFARMAVRRFGCSLGVAH